MARSLTSSSINAAGLAELVFTLLVCVPTPARLSRITQSARTRLSGCGGCGTGMDVVPDCEGWRVAAGAGAADFVLDGDVLARARGE